MIRVITNGGTARVLLERRAADTNIDEVVAGVRECADIGVEELVIATQEVDEGWLEVLEEALTDTPGPLRIWVAVGDPEPDPLDV